MRSLLSGIVSSIVFLGLFIGLKFALPVAAILGVAAYAGVFLVSKPTLKIGKTPISQLQDGEEIKLAFEEGAARVEKLGELTKDISNLTIKEKTRELYSIGSDIINYLKRHPESISSSRYFLDYYLKTSNKIITNYIELKTGNISPEKFEEMTKMTIESLDLLNTVFKNQRDSYYTDTLMETEVENEVLEKTMKIRGDN